MTYQNIQMKRAYTDSAFKLLLGASIGAVFCGLYFSPLLARLEYISVDLLFRLRGPLPVSEKIIMIDIDDHSLSEIGRWPWSREYHATMITLLKNLGARAVILDILFSEPQDEVNDEVLAAAIELAGNVYVPTGVVSSRHGRAEKALEPLPQILKAIKGTGHIHSVPDRDGVMRRAALFTELPNKVRLPHFMLSVFLKENAAELDSLRIIPGKEIILPIQPEAMRIPVDTKLNLWINWAGPWNRSFRHYSFTDTLINYNRYLTGKPADIRLDDFKDAFCIVGVTATTLYDNKPSPLEPEYPGPGINATILNSLLTRSFVSELPSRANLLVIFLSAIVMSLMTSRLHPWRSVLSMIAAVAVFFGLSFYGFSGRHVIGSIAHPILALVASYLAATVYGHIILVRDRRRLSEQAERDSLTALYNVAHFNKLLERWLLRMNLNPRGTNPPFSILMGDIDHFKRVNDTYGHQAGDFVLRRVASVLQSQCRAEDVVARYGGEEFIVIVPGCGLDQALRIAEKLRRGIEAQKYREVSSGLKVTMSFGAAVRQEGEESESLIGRVDRALYSAKQKGRNRVEPAA